MEKAALASRIRKLLSQSDLLAHGMLSGTFRSAFRGRGAEFSELREYTLKDDARSVDWNVTARMGRPFARSYREEREIGLFLAMDCSASMACGPEGDSPLERAAVCASLLAWAAQANGDRTGFCAFSEGIRDWLSLRGGRKHALAILDAASSQEGSGESTDIASALATIRTSLKKRGVIVVLSDFLAPPFLEEVRRTAARHDLILVRLGGQLESSSLPRAGTFPVRDPETGARALLPFSSAAFREGLDAWRRRPLEEYRRAAASPHVRALEILPGQDPASALLSFFGRGRGRRR